MKHEYKEQFRLLIEIVKSIFVVRRFAVDIQNQKDSFLISSLTYLDVFIVSKNNFRLANSANVSRILSNATNTYLMITYLFHLNVSI